MIQFPYCITTLNRLETGGKVGNQPVSLLLGVHLTTDITLYARHLNIRNTKGGRALTSTRSWDYVSLYIGKHVKQNFLLATDYHQFDHEFRKNQTISQNTNGHSYVQYRLLKFNSCSAWSLNHLYVPLWWFKGYVLITFIHKFPIGF